MPYLFAAMFIFSSWEYYAQCFNIFTLLGMKAAKVFLCICIFLKYSYLFIILYRFVLQFIKDFNDTVRTINDIITMIEFFGEVIRAVLLYFIGFFLTFPKVQTILPPKVRFWIKIAIFIMYFGFIIDILIQNIESSQYYSIRVLDKISRHKSMVITEVFNVTSLILIYGPLMCFIFLLSIGGQSIEKDSDDNASELNSVIL